jgi:hypothetical protein
MGRPGEVRRAYFSFLPTLTSIPSGAKLIGIDSAEGNSFGLMGVASFPRFLGVDKIWGVGTDENRQRQKPMRGFFAALRMTSGVRGYDKRLGLEADDDVAGALAGGFVDQAGD